MLWLLNWAEAVKANDRSTVLAGEDRAINLWIGGLRHRADLGGLGWAVAGATRDEGVGGRPRGLSPRVMGRTEDERERWGREGPLRLGLLGHACGNTSGRRRSHGVERARLLAQAWGRK